MLLFSSCIIFPTPAHRIRGRVFITPEMIAFIKPDITNRENVILNLGDPDGVALNEKVMIYHWTVIKGYAVVSGGYSSSGSDICQERFFLISFNPDNTVCKMELFNRNLNNLKKPMSQFIEEWNAGSKKK